MLDLLTTINTTINAAVAANGQKPWLSTDNDSTSSYVLNTSCWAYNLSTNKFRSRAVYGPLARHDGPTLIAEEGKTTTRFAIVANHYTENGITGTCRFLKSNGTVLAATISNSARIWTTDIRLVIFSAPIAATDVGAAKLMPSNLGDYLSGFPLAAISVKSNNADTTLKVTTQDITTISGGTTTSPASSRINMYEAVDNGDSGSPLYTVVNNQEVLIGTWYGKTYAPAIHEHLTELATAASTLAGESVNFTTVDLSAYTVIYPPPTVVSCSITPNILTKGQSATLSWNVAGANSININNGIGTVNATGSVSVIPTSSTVYTLTATSPSHTVTADAFVGVTGSQNGLLFTTKYCSANTNWSTMTWWATPTGIVTTPPTELDIVNTNGKNVVLDVANITVTELDANDGGFALTITEGNSCVVNADVTVNGTGSSAFLVQANASLTLNGKLYVDGKSCSGIIYDSPANITINNPNDVAIEVVGSINTGIQGATGNFHIIGDLVISGETAFGLWIGDGSNCIIDGNIMQTGPEDSCSIKITEGETTSSFELNGNLNILSGSESFSGIVIDKCDMQINGNIIVSNGLTGIFLSSGYTNINGNINSTGNGSIGFENNGGTANISGTIISSDGALGLKAIAGSTFFIGSSHHATSLSRMGGLLCSYGMPSTNSTFTLACSTSLVVIPLPKEVKKGTTYGGLLNAVGTVLLKKIINNGTFHNRRF